MKTTAQQHGETILMKITRMFVRITTVILLLFSLTGCQVLDELVAQLMDSGGLSARNEYTLSCIDLMVVKDGPGMIVSHLAPQLKKAVEDGVQASQKTDKGKNLRVGNSPSTDDREKLYKYVLKDDGITSEMRREYLKGVCDKSVSNMLLYGIYTGDDLEIKVICFLYRKDLNDFTVSDPISFSRNLPERRQNEIVSEVVRNLLDKSLPEPGKPDNRKIKKIVEDAGAVAGPALLTGLIQYLLNNNNQ